MQSNGCSREKQNDELSRYMLQNQADGFPAPKSEIRGSMCLLYIYDFYFSTQVPDFISLYPLFSKVIQDTTLNDFVSSK